MICVVFRHCFWHPIPNLWILFDKTKKLTPACILFTRNYTHAGVVFLCFTNSIWSIYFVIFMFKNKGKKKFKDKKITDTRRTLCSYSGFNGRFWKRDVQNWAPSAPRRGGVWKYLTEFCKILRYLLAMSWDPLHIQSEKILSQKKTHVFCWSYR